MFVDGVDTVDKIFDGTLLKLAQAHPGVARLNDFATHRLCPNLFTDDGDLEGAAFVFAENSQHNFTFGLATHSFHGFIQAQAFNCRVVNSGNEVVGLETRTVSG